MTEDRIKNLLKEADRMAAGPGPVPANLAHVVRRRAHRTRVANITTPIAAAAVVLIAVGIWQLSGKVDEGASVPLVAQERTVVSQADIQQLVARTDALVEFVHEVLEQERSRQRLAELEMKLASIPDPLYEIQKGIDKTAFILLYQADRMYRELDLKDSAVEAYNRVIELFPENRWAETARQRLSEIENKKDKLGKGDLLWIPKRV
jgi:hypothetical protein